ncbi:hypothetical protein F183_A43820 [Bryobacterales bacterium F-183]|nr:hypothetical protein F183_A43820 [Bryobacterales bacterium F-183]
MIRFLGAWAVFGVALYADDSSGGVPLPPWYSTSSSIQVNASSVRFDASQVAVQLQLSAANPGTFLHFTTPKLEWLGEGEPYPSRHFPELRVTDATGAAIPIREELRAYVTATKPARDITLILKQYKLDPLLVADSEPPVIVAPPEQLNALRRVAAVGEGENPLAQWSVQRTVRVAVRGKQVTFHYMARPAFRLVTKIAELPGGYCLADQQAKDLASRLPAVVKEYAIPIGIAGHKYPQAVSVSGLGADSFYCSGPAPGRAAVAPDGTVRILVVSPTS